MPSFKDFYFLKEADPEDEFKPLDLGDDSIDLDEPSDFSLSGSNDEFSEIPVGDEFSEIPLDIDPVEPDTKPLAKREYNSPKFSFIVKVTRSPENTLIYSIDAFDEFNKFLANFPIREDDINDEKADIRDAKKVIQGITST